MFRRADIFVAQRERLPRKVNRMLGDASPEGCPSMCALPDWKYKAHTLFSSDFSSAPCCFFFLWRKVPFERDALPLQHVMFLARVVFHTCAKHLPILLLGQVLRLLCWKEHECVESRLMQRVPKLASSFLVGVVKLQGVDFWRCRNN